VSGQIARVVGDITNDYRAPRDEGGAAEAVAARKARMGRRRRPIPAEQRDLFDADFVKAHPAISPEGADGGRD
jgi:hypothetical protein